MSTDTFSRTGSGKLAQYLFHDVPLVWVEGKTDKIAYEPLSRRYSFDMRPAGGRPECLALAKRMAEENLPFLVILDGDYEALQRKRSFHKRAVFLDRYSVENYYCEKSIVDSFVRRFAGVPPEREVKHAFQEMVKHIESELDNLVVHDIAAELLCDGDGPLPRAANELLEDPSNYRLDEERITYLVEEAEEDLNDSCVEKAKKLIEEWEERGMRMVDIVRGHVLFGILARVISSGIENHRGDSPNYRNTTLLAFGAEMCWFENVRGDRKRLRRRIRSGVREVRRLLNSSS